MNDRVILVDYLKEKGMDYFNEEVRGEGAQLGHTLRDDLLIGGIIYSLEEYYKTDISFGTARRHLWNLDKKILLDITEDVEFMDNLDKLIEEMKQEGIDWEKVYTDDDGDVRFIVKNLLDRKMWAKWEKIKRKYTIILKRDFIGRSLGKLVERYAPYRLLKVNKKEEKENEEMTNKEMIKNLIEVLERVDKENKSGVICDEGLRFANKKIKPVIMELSKEFLEDIGIETIKKLL
jgi:hypothetical protein